MSDRFKSILPTLAVAGVFLFLATIIFEARRQPAFLVDSGVNRPAALALLSELESIHPDSAVDVRLVQWADRAKGQPAIGRVDLYAADGSLVSSPKKKGLLALFHRKSPSRVESMIPADAQGALDALPKGSLTGDQEALLRAAFAIRAEGEHNDIFRHLVRPVRNEAGQTVAIAAVAYAVKRTVSGGDDILWLAGGLARLLGLAIYLLSLTAWVFLDAKGRERHPWLWAAFVLVGQLVGLLVYLLVRRNVPADGKA